MRQRLLTLILCVALMPLFSTVPSLFAGEPDTVLEVKASFLLNFMRFTQWPPNDVPVAGQHLVLAVLGNSPLAAQIKDSLDGQFVKDRPIQVNIYANLQLLRQAPSMPQALFVTAGMSGQWPEIAGIVATYPVLTMADFPDFCAQGGMLNLVRDHDRIRFEANPEAARNAYLKLNAQLLQLANIVLTRREIRP